MEYNEVTQPYSSLDAVLRDIGANKQVDYNDPVVKDVEATVRQMVWKLVQEVCKLHDDIRVKDILEAGSFYDGTKLGFPDEFDFMIVFDIGHFTVQTGCAKGLVELSKNDQATDRSFNGRYVKECVVEKFRSEVAQQVSNFMEKKVTCKGQTGDIMVRDFSIPMLQLSWINRVSKEDVRIKIDLMPALVCPDNFTSAFGHTYSDIVRENRLYLVPKTCPYCHNNSCWHMSFARSESYLMRSMDACHKTVYRVLKYLVQIKQTDADDVVGGTTSYMLKNAIFHHVYNSSCHSDCSLGKCVLVVLKYLNDCYSSLNMPIFFVPDWCLFRHGLPRFCRLDSIIMCKHLNEIAKQTLLGNESFALTVESSIQQCWQYLVWNEYNRRYICLIRNVLHSVVEDRIHVQRTETFVKRLDSLVRFAESIQPAMARAVDVTENEYLIMSLKDSRKHIIIHDFLAIQDEAAKMFDDLDTIHDVDLMYPFTHNASATEGTTQSENNTAPSELTGMCHVEGKGHKAADTGISELYSRTLGASMLEPARTFEVLQERPSVDCDSDLLAVATTRSASLYSQLYLVMVLQCGVQLEDIFSHLHSISSTSNQNEFHDEDMEAYDTILLQYLDENYG